MLFCFNITSLKAQSFSSLQILKLVRNKLATDVFLAKGFNKVYGGPRKEGGTLYLFYHKRNDEYIFVNASKSCIVTGIDYYLPNKAIYQNLIPRKTELSPGEDYYPRGRVVYNGKKILSYNIHILIAGQ